MSGYAKLLLCLFPRAEARGLIEAGCLGFALGLVSADFREQKLAASLTLGVARRAYSSRSHFREQKLAASWKPCGASRRRRVKIISASSSSRPLCSPARG